MTKRQVVLDTETTGLETALGHRVIEIGCIELLDRRLTGRHYHQYLNPDREIDPGAVEIHGISNEFLADKPQFAQIVDEFLAFIRDAELLIHNAAFDLDFLDHELSRIDESLGRICDYCSVLDTLALARSRHPGQKNSLDALCKRYAVDNSQRELHGALLDAEILADVYLRMSGGQTKLALGGTQFEATDAVDSGLEIRRLDPERESLPVIVASVEEIAEHEACLDRIDAASGGKTLWRRDSTS